MADKPKRPGSMDDAQRALIGKEHRARAATPVEGVPIATEEDDDYTPIGHIINRVEERIGPLTARERFILQSLGQHTANMELRSRKRSDSQETGTLRRELDELQTAIVDISGRDGKNGKLGALKERIDKAEARRWSVMMWLAGLVVAVLTAAIAIGSWVGSIESDVEGLKTRMYLYRNSGNRFPPEWPAASKDQP